MLAAVALCLLGSPPEVAFSGNVVLPDEVYRALLVPLPALSPEDHRVAVEVTILEFLRRAGYQLARVRTQLEGGVLLVEIDEGRLDKVVFLGQGLLESLGLQLEQVLPGSVFNGLMLERRLRSIRDRYGLVPSEIELVPIRAADGPPLDLGLDLALTNTLDDYLSPGGAYELHVAFSSGSWPRGLGVVAAINSLDGFVLGARYREVSLVAPDDRTELEGRVGLRAPSPGSEQGPFSRLEARLRYQAPPLGTFRPEVRLGTELLRRHRPDLGVRVFHAFRSQATFGLELQLGLEGTVTLSAGIEDLRVFGVDALAPPADLPLEARRIRGFGRLESEIVLDPTDVRLDLRPLLEGDMTHYIADSGATATFAHAMIRSYERFGWHDLIYSMRGDVAFGDVLYVEETSLADHLRGVFGDRYATRIVGSAHAEFRFAVRRDRFKVGLFVDAALFRAHPAGRDDAPLLPGIPRVAPTVEVMGGFVAGLGLHGLVLDAFQIDAYYGGGMTTEGSVDHGVSARLIQAY